MRLPRTLSLPLALYRTAHSSSASRNKTTAAIVVIGDEILRGDVRDSNAYFLIKNLRRYGVAVKKVNFIADDVNEIGTTVREFSKKYDHVLTCGGVGPTHDDITYEAIATAFGQNVALRKDMWDMFKMYFGNLDDSSPLSKFARIPEQASAIIEQVAHSSRKFNVCMVRLGNVVILPGVPLVTEKLFPVLVKHLDLQEMAEISRQVYVALDEASFTDKLNEAVERFKDVTFGSYPELFGNYYKTRLRLEGPSEEVLDEVEIFLRKNLPRGSVLDNYINRPLDDADKHVQRLCLSYPEVREAYKIITTCLSRYKPDEICVGFSGGKDCTAVAFLYHAALIKLRKTSSSPLPHNWLYIQPNSVRQEVEKFVLDSKDLYGARVLTLAPPYKEALRTAVDKGKKVFLLGNRIVDPKGETLEPFKETDPDWPRAMRVFPILNWSYGDVWRFIRELQIPYCSLYDQGFSSLGERSSPNPKLAFVDERGVTRFKPAYLLQDTSAERYGRA